MSEAAPRSAGAWIELALIASSRARSRVVASTCDPTWPTICRLGATALPQTSAETLAGVAAPDPPEQRFPVPIVGLHGLLAATTLVLVLLTALKVGGS